jgi:serine/threonine protein kinase
VLKPYQKAEISFSEINEIGTDGKNSKVFLVHDFQLDAEIAIKKIEKKSISDINEYFAESRRLYISRHPNVIDIHYACEDTDYIYLAMPYYKNGSLKNYIDKNFLTMREVIRYSIQFLTGLHNIHSKKLIHFDVKPDNILIDNNNEALISDFGQSKPTNHLGIAGHDRLYVKQRPPEAFKVDHFDYRYDLYQVGVTLYRMCNGNDFFYKQYFSYCDPSGKLIEKDNFRFDVTNGRFPSRNTYLPHVPKKMREIIKTCLSINPDERYNNCIDLINNLSLIDKSLDWRYQLDSINGNQIWVSDRTDKVIKLVNSNNDYVATKTMKDSGRTHRITKYCKKDLTERELFSFFNEE